MATHTNIGAMLGDLHNWIQAHPGCEVLAADNPRTFPAEVGYYAYVPMPPNDPTPEVSFQVSTPITGLRAQCSDELWSYMGSAAGRQALARVLTTPVPPLPPSRNPCGEERLVNYMEVRPLYPTAWEHLLAEDPV